MKASIQALENIAKEMKKKGIQKISMMGKSDPKTMEKMEAMGESEEPSEMDEMMAEKKDDDSVVPPSEVVGGSAEDEPKEEMASEDDPELSDKLALIKKLLSKV